MRTRTRSDFLIAFRTAGGDDSRSRSMRELNGASSNRTRTALHQHRAPLERTRRTNSPMSGYAGNTETGALFHRHGFGQWNHLLQRHHGIFGGGTKRTVRLSPITPHMPSDPFLCYSLAHGVNDPRT